MCEEESAVTLVEEVDWDAAAPFHCATAALPVVHAERDKLWLANLDGVSEGKVIS